MQSKPESIKLIINKSEKNLTDDDLNAACAFLIFPDSTYENGEVTKNDGSKQKFSPTSNDTDAILVFTSVPHPGMVISSHTYDKPEDGKNYISAHAFLNRTEHNDTEMDFIETVCMCAWKLLKIDY